jgi:hypothetical protein
LDDLLVTTDVLLGHLRKVPWWYQWGALAVFAKTEPGVGWQKIKEAERNGVHKKMEKMI